MGESGTRRSTLVSRLPIFRRSVRKRQDSLPSSPSSGGVGNGVHTSSPSSTNSSSSSTGKRRSLFRTPSLSFHSKRNSDPTQLSLDNRSQGSDATFREGSITKTRHSFGFGGHKKKITRSQTEDLEKVSTNRSVFINCISSGTNEGDDSGFLDDVSSKRSSKHKKQLLPKSLSAHQRFSKNSSNVPDKGKGQDAVEDPPKTGTPGSWPGELAESSLQSPMISEDRTTAITPSDFVHVTEDSVSEVDALPVPSPAAPPENFSQAVSTSQVSFTPAQASTEKHLLPDTSHTANTQCESTTAHTEPVTLQTVQELNPNTNPDRSEASELEQAPELSEDSSSNPDARERRSRNTVLIQQAGRSSGLSKLETRPSHLRKPHTVSMCSSVSPYHEVMRMERRLRSASEGAGGPRLHLNLRDPHCMEGNTLSKQRTSSSSSKLGSLDVLNNLGSSELDEDDLMLDLDLSDDQRPHHDQWFSAGFASGPRLHIGQVATQQTSREDSSQSLASCLNLLPSPLEASTERTPGRDPKEPPLREQRPMSLCLSRDDEPLPGLEMLPFRLMQQDCTAVKTLLLRLRRTLQESAEISPASSLHSLPISPCSEKSLPFKDPGREENQILQQQLKEKDELIVRLQAELESTRSALKSLCQKADKSTQTDFLLSEAIHPSRPTGQNSNIPSSSSSSSSLTRERRPARTSAAEQHSRPCEERACSNGGVGLRRAEGGQSVSEVSGPRKTEHPGPSQIPRAVAGSSMSLPSKASPSRSLSSDSERGPRSERGPIPRLQSSFTGRLGQPPRGPLSLHMYSRKNVFLQHSLHTAELQALAQQDG
ncbi:serine-rich coiled-coil domain-containing protein 1 isoform X1 [Puntigrus tetrazona]|uniref:serine-rich coiled-coil domain-containing protein 1 isoform X1 n=2 Tax=Puntigrus tetrazona TaxID=1606681 RepID=UPI001C8A9D6D|nr:serine-rich coiled-coil domain-containing protein 1 isoform X1 [Puntigrus tetrazona]XP_043102964.1 serine-rich coiled-coil domain-containing protein 1 isoform X1 [Puntigrus tetrazona]